jgi:hypothetical protein
MASVATSKAFIPVVLAILWLWLLRIMIVVPWSWGFREIGRRLLWRWPDHPTSLLLLRASAVIIGDNLEALRLS